MFCSSNSFKIAETIGAYSPPVILVLIRFGSNQTKRSPERLPPGIVASESDYYLRRLWGNPSEDLTSKPKYLVTFTVGLKQKHSIDAAVKKLGYMTCQKHGLEISQPDLDPRKGTTWPMTIRRGDEIMAPRLFPRDAWRCVWHMIQNDLIMVGDLTLRYNAKALSVHSLLKPAHENWSCRCSMDCSPKQPSLGNEGQAKDGKAAWRGVRERCEKEWSMFQSRAENAEKAYYKSNGIDISNFTYKNGINLSNSISH
ncbi:hypothetical protein HAX54_034181 [Datura stramonium]|uniref:Uncharacterized protein n=1 Tax=Datura stramonium TaxID=4076 RepID=A0ABS8SE73_DATST|nr:hypothetical protein [Datura stramonium]